MKISEEVINAIKMFSVKSVEETLDNSVYVQLYQKSINETVIKAENGKARLKLKLYGGVEGKYRTTIFVNNKPVQIDGKDAVESVLSVKKMSEYEFELDLSKYGKMNTIYAITVPADDACLEIIRRCEKSDSRLLVNDNSENIEADGGPEIHNDNQDISLKEEAGEVDVFEKNAEEIIYPLDDRLQNVLQVYQNEGKTKVLAVNEENFIFLYNITDDKLYSYQLDKNKNRDWDNYKIISCDNDIIISVDITKMNISEKKEAKGVEIIAGNVLDEKKRIYVFDQKMKLKEKYNINSETITALTLAGKKGFLAFNNGNICYYSLKNGMGKY